MSRNPYQAPVAKLEQAEERPAGHSRLFRWIGIACAVLLAAYALAETFWFYSFTRFYFPKASTEGLFVRLAILGLMFMYFIGVAIRARLTPWRRPVARA